MTRTLYLTAAACLVFQATGCRSATTKYFHPNADLGALRTVAVMPFENLTQERASGEKVQKIFLTELLALGIFDVVEPGAVVKVLRTERVESIEALGPAEIKRVAEALKADALFLGSVVDFADARTGSTPTPEVTIQLRLVEAQSGVTLWSTSRTRSGAGIMSRLFGVGGSSLTQAARELIRAQLRTLTR